jgi:DNA-binding winged helix-turn-helix (wHTH) protein/tetratricopeptide (TPR) repeat protein
MPQKAAEQCLALGECQFDASRGLLLRNGAEVPLRPKAFALLAHLAANAGRVVGKSELIETVWPETIVTEDSLTQAVREVRKALGEKGQDAIRTVARRGYLLSALQPEVEQLHGQPVVAVLRFTNEGAKSDEPVVDGFAEDLVISLASFRRVVVLARSTTFSFGSEAALDSKEIGRRLSANFLIQGRMRFSTDGLQARVSLIDAANGAVLWSEKVSVQGAAVFDAQEELALKIVNRLVSRFDDASLARSSARPPTSLAAYELVLRGIARFRGYREEDNAAAKQFFELAAAKDPGYALAHAYGALVDLAIAGYGEAPSGVIAECVRRASAALTLAPEDPRCHRILAMTRLHAREHAAAEYHLLRSIELNPYDADTMAQMGYLLTMRGKPFEAIAWLDRAVRINPVHPDWYHYDRGMALYAAGEYQAAIDSLAKLPTKTPWRLTRLAACCAQLGNHGEARRLVAEIKRTAPDYSPMDFARHGVVFEHQSDVDHLAEGVSRALDAWSASQASSDA